MQVNSLNINMLTRKNNVRNLPSRLSLNLLSKRPDLVFEIMRSVLALEEL